MCGGHFTSSGGAHKNTPILFSNKLGEGEEGVFTITSRGEGAGDK